MRIAITGGNGDMGSNLIPYLLSQGHTVVSIDRSVPVGYRHDVNYISADVRDFGQLAGCIHGCDALVHLAAIRSPGNHPDHVVYADNTISSYNALSAASVLGIKHICLASSINAIGGAFSRSPRYDYFPVDEKHPTYSEDPYSLSKWVMEQQADAFARRFEWMTVSSFRFHWLLDTYDQAVKNAERLQELSIRHLWGYTLLEEASRAILLSLTADFKGHEVFYITAARTASHQLSSELARQHYPQVEIRSDFSDHTSFFNCSKAEQLLGWKHQEN